MSKPNKPGRGVRDGVPEPRCEKCAELRYRPCSVECYVARGYDAANYDAHMARLDAEHGPKTPVLHRVRVRSTHGQLRIASVPVEGKKPKLYWLHPTGEDLQVDDETLGIFKGDPVLQVEEKDVPQERPRNYVEMPSLADALPKGSQEIAVQPYPSAKVDPSVLPGPTPRQGAADDESDDDDVEVTDGADKPAGDPKGTPDDDDGDGAASAAKK